MAQTIAVEARNAVKEFGSGASAVRALDDVSISIREGEFFTLLGPSGCGKTTLLRLIAGFEMPSAGKILLNGQDITYLPPNRRPVNTVFQSYALFPHLTVAQNIGFGLEMQGRPASEVKATAARMLALVKMEAFANRKIGQLSGGQQQRVALARAIVNEPKVLLLDEPLAALDRKLRREMQIELQTLQRQLGITFVLVTHDQEEALSMSDRICIMRGGRIVQSGTPDALYDQPVNRYVADFVGKSNFIDGRFDGGVVTPSGHHFTGRIAGAPAQGAAVTLSLRPEQIGLTHAAGEPVTVINRIFLGEHTEYLVRHAALGDLLVLVARQAEAAEGGFAPGDAGFIGWGPDAGLIVPQE